MAQWGEPRRQRLEETIQTTTVIPVSDQPLSTVAELRHVMGRPLAGGLCLVVDQPTWATPPGSLNQMPFELDGRLHQLVLRPLMPHEDDCDDVAQTMAELPL